MDSLMSTIQRGPYQLSLFVGSEGLVLALYPEGSGRDKSVIAWHISKEDQVEFCDVARNAHLHCYDGEGTSFDFVITSKQITGSFVLVNDQPHERMILWTLEFSKESELPQISMELRPGELGGLETHIKSYWTGYDVFYLEKEGVVMLN